MARDYLNWLSELVTKVMYQEMAFLFNFVLCNCRFSRRWWRSSILPGKKGTGVRVLAVQSYFMHNVLTCYVLLLLFLHTVEQREFIPRIPDEKFPYIIIFFSKRQKLRDTSYLKDTAALMYKSMCRPKKLALGWTDCPFDTQEVLTGYVTQDN